MAATWASIGPRSVSSIQATTEAAPSVATDGMLLEAVAAVTVWLEADAGQTISADVGQVDVYQHDIGAWGAAPALVLQVPPGSSGHRRVQLGTVRIDNPRGRLACIANGVSVSSGGVTVYIVATSPLLGGGQAAA